jgi:hypothetical protein
MFGCLVIQEWWLLDFDELKRVAFEIFRTGI